ncbi:hypothetical protein MBANPS3_010782, partial [Mucor bainieri]
LINREAQVLPRQDAFERMPPAALAEKNKNNNPASTSGNTSAALPPSSSSGYTSAASSPKSNSSPESLSTTVHRVRMQSNVALADLSDKIETLTQKNMASTDKKITTVNDLVLQEEDYFEGRCNKLRDHCDELQAGLDRQSKLITDTLNQLATEFPKVWAAIGARQETFETLSEAIDRQKKECDNTKAETNEQLLDLTNLLEALAIRVNAMVPGQPTGETH